MLGANLAPLPAQQRVPMPLGCHPRHNLTRMATCNTTWGVPTECHFPLGARLGGRPCQAIPGGHVGAGRHSSSLPGSTKGTYAIGGPFPAKFYYRDHLQPHLGCANRVPLPLGARLGGRPCQAIPGGHVGAGHHSSSLSCSTKGTYAIGGPFLAKFYYHGHLVEGFASGMLLCTI